MSTPRTSPDRTAPTGDPAAVDIAAAVDPTDPAGPTGPAAGQPGDPTATRIGELRQRIDAADRAIIDLVKQRIAASAEVGALRMATGGPRLVLAREQQIIGHYRDELGAEGAQLAMLLLRASRGRL